MRRFGLASRVSVDHGGAATRAFARSLVGRSPADDTRKHTRIHSSQLQPHVQPAAQVIGFPEITSHPSPSEPAASSAASGVGSGTVAPAAATDGPCREHYPLLGLHCRLHRLHNCLHRRRHRLRRRCAPRCRFVTSLPPPPVKPHAARDFRPLGSPCVHHGSALGLRGRGRADGQSIPEVRHAWLRPR